ncbi:hypothetical protein LG315_05115 [Microbacterium marinum]|uniref:hypothetical protein n=1 Tax=Microbacterium marinum TaxID=421115 RepID=UPI00384FF297
MVALALASRSSLARIRAIEIATGTDPPHEPDTTMAGESSTREQEMKRRERRALGRAFALTHATLVDSPAFVSDPELVRAARDELAFHEILMRCRQRESWWVRTIVTVSSSSARARSDGERFFHA